RLLLRPPRQFVLKFRPDQFVPLRFLLRGQQRQDAVYRPLHRRTKFAGAWATFAAFIVPRRRSIEFAWRRTAKTSTTRATRSTRTRRRRSLAFALRPLKFTSPELVLATFAAEIPFATPRRRRPRRPKSSWTALSPAARPVFAGRTTLTRRPRIKLAAPLRRLFL